MITRFVRESLQEFRHVAWPTRQETKQYFTIVTALIAVLTVLIFIVISALSSGFFALKNGLQPFMPQLQPVSTPPAVTTTGSGVKKPIKLSDIKLDTGSTTSGAQTQSGATPTATAATK